MAKAETQETFNLLHYITYLVVITINGLFNLLPYSWMQFLGGVLGRLVYYCNKPRRDITMDNLRKAYGDSKSEQELRRIARGSFENMVRVYLEVSRVPKLMKNFSRYVTIERENLVWKALEKKKGAILIGSHYGNWELLGLMGGLVGYPVSAVARPFKNKYIYDQLLKNRQLTGLKLLPNRGVAREMLRALKQNRIAAIIFDQYAGRRGIVVPLFGRDAYTHGVVAQLALKTGAPVLALFITRQPDGTHKIFVEDPIELVDTGNKVQDIIANTKSYNDLLEKWIRKNPDQWFWFHKRWKTPRY